MDNNFNRVRLCGRAAGEPALSHINHGEHFYRFPLSVERLSGQEDLLPVISFNAKASAEDARKHEDFVTRMESKGYTPKQVRLLCEWYLRVRKSS